SYILLRVCVLVISYCRLHITRALLLSSSSFFFFLCFTSPRALHSFPTRRSSDLVPGSPALPSIPVQAWTSSHGASRTLAPEALRSEEHTSELQSRENIVCRLLLEKKKNYSNSQ